MWKVLTWALSEDDGAGESEEFDDAGGKTVVEGRSFFFSFSTCFISSAAILSPLPPRERPFFRSTAWASLRLSQQRTHVQNTTTLSLSKKHEDGSSEMFSGSEEPKTMLMKVFFFFF